MPRLRESRSERPHREVSSQISSDRISEGDRRRRLAVTIAAAGDRGEGEARTGGAYVPARLRRSVVRIMMISRRCYERCVLGARRYAQGPRAAGKKPSTALWDTCTIQSERFISFFSRPRSRGLSVDTTHENWDFRATLLWP